MDQDAANSGRKAAEIGRRKPARKGQRLIFTRTGTNSLVVLEMWSWKKKIDPRKRGVYWAKMETRSEAPSRLSLYDTPGNRGVETYHTRLRRLAMGFPILIQEWR